MEYRDYRRAKVVRYLDSFKNNWRVCPPSLQIGLTDRCLNNCIMCGHWNRSEKTDIDFNNLSALLWYLRRFGLESVCYSGGDPFVYHKLKSVFDLHAKIDIDFGFITAGYIREDMVYGLRNASFVRVSLDAVDDGIYGQCRGGISVSKVLGSVLNMLNHGVRVGLGITAHNLNYNDIPDIFVFALKNGIKEVRLWPCREVDGLGLNAEQAKFVGKLALDNAQRFDNNGISNNLSEIGGVLYHGTSETDGLKFSRCYACMYQLFICPNGDVHPCCIIAGDTQSYSHSNPLFSIAGFSNLDSYEKDHVWGQNWSAVLAYNKRTIDNLPPICSRNCIPRLSTINCYAEESMNDRHFL